jgi:hypothetical protein
MLFDRVMSKIRHGVEVTLLVGQKSGKKSDSHSFFGKNVLFLLHFWIDLAVLLTPLYFF